MKKILALAILSFYVCSLSWAQSIQDKRRVEEEKRKDLSLSEFYLPEAKKMDMPDVQEGQNTYFSQLFTKETADLADAYKALVILMGAEGRYPDTASQFAFLKEEGIIPKSVLIKADDHAPLRKGAAAYMFAKMMGIKGGITIKIFGLSERYAFKELVYQEIMRPGNVHDVMSGPELILTITRAADAMADRQNNDKRK